MLDRNLSASINMLRIGTNSFLLWHIEHTREMVAMQRITSDASSVESMPDR